MLDYRYHTFTTLVETRSYTKTAKKINFTQPAVTKHIQYIEKELNTNLVIYKDQTLTITNAGIYLYHKIKELQQDIQGIQNHLMNDTSLKIGTSKTIGEYFIPDKINTYSKAFPNSRISLMVDNTQRLLELLANHQIDLALISGPMPEKPFTKEAFYSDTIVLIVHPSHPYAGKNITFNDLFNETVIFRETGSGLLEAVEQSFSLNNIRLSDFSRKQFVGNINLIKKMVINNEGCSFIYQSSIQDELASGAIATATIDDLISKQDYYVVLNSRNDLNKATRFFISLLKEKKPETND